MAAITEVEKLHRMLELAADEAYVSEVVETGMEPLIIPSDYINRAEWIDVRKERWENEVLDKAKEQ